MSYGTALIPFGWPIVLYLTLAGLACGAVLCAVLFLYSQEKAKDGQAPVVFKTGLYLAIVAILTGALFLIYDLGSSDRFYLNFSQFNPSSAIAWGTRIISLFVLLCIYSLILIHRRAESDSIGPVLGALLVLFALAVGIYPAFVLAQAVARPLWDPLFLVPLFLVLGVNTGFAGVQLLTYRRWTDESLAQLRNVDIAIVFLEIALFISMLTASSLSPAALDRFFKGDLALWFWLGVVVIGWGWPLLVSFRHKLSVRSMVSAQLGFIVGAFALRTIIVFGGQGPQSFLGA